MDFIKLVAIAVILFCLIYVLASIKNGKFIIRFQSSKIIAGILFAFYVTILLEVMLLNRTIREVHQINLIPFWSYREYVESKLYMLLIQMIYNILAFLPWPILLTRVLTKLKKLLWSVGSAFLFALFIETMQLVFRLGMFEFDDIFHNVMGALIGYGILILWEKMRKINDRS